MPRLRYASPLLLWFSSAALTGQGGLSAQQFLSVGDAHAQIETDGRVLIALHAGQSASDVRRLFDAETVRVGSDRKTLLVDREGIEWTWTDDRIVGRRAGAVVHEHATDSRPFLPRAIEDARGRRWFACGVELVLFDGQAWSGFAGNGIGGWGAGTAIDAVVPRVSDDRQHVYFMRSRPDQCVAIGDGDDGPELLGLQRAKQWEVGNQVVPLNDGRVACSPGYVVLGLDRRVPFQRAKQRMYGAHRPQRALVNSAVGRFVVPARSQFLHSHGGPLIVRATHGWESESSPPEDWQLLLTPECRLPHPRRLVPRGRLLMLHVDPTGAARRASGVEEAFEPTYVDRTERLWRHRKGHAHGRQSDASLSFLRDGLAWTLVDSERSAPVRVSHFFGVDRERRMYFSVGTSELIVWDEGAPAAESARFEWRKGSVDVWLPEREAEALDAVRAAVRSSNFVRAHRVAQRFGAIADATRGVLRESRLWRQLVPLLDGVAGGYGVRPLWGKTKSAELLGLEALAVTILETACRDARSANGSAQYRGALVVADVLERQGAFQRALDMHQLAFEGGSVRGQAPAKLVLNATRCAVRLRRLDVALDWLDRWDGAASDGTRETLRTITRAIKRASEGEPSAASELDFVLSYWIHHRIVPGQAEALAHLIDHVELDREALRFCMQTLVEARIVEGDLSDATARIARWEASGDYAMEPALQARLDVADAYRERGEFDQALRAFGALPESSRGTVFEHRARLGIARTHLAAGDAGQAFQVARPLVDMVDHEARAAYGLTAYDGYDVALLLARALEELDQPEGALVSARAARDQFRAPVRIGHHGGPRVDVGRIIARLEARPETQLETQLGTQATAPEDR